MSARQAPSALSGAAIILGLLSFALVVGGLVLGVKAGDWSGGMVLVGLAIFSGWGVYAVLDSALSNRLGLGGRLALTGFLIGSLLGMYDKPFDVFTEFPTSSPWMSFCWLSGTVLTVIGLEIERRRSPIVQPTPQT